MGLQSWQVGFHAFSAHGVAKRETEQAQGAGQEHVADGGKRQERFIMVYLQMFGTICLAHGLLLTSFLWSTWHCTTGQICDSQTSSYHVPQETPWSVCHPLRFEVCLLFSQQTQVIPYHTKERWQWCSAPVQLTLISPADSWAAFGKDSYLQDPFLWQHAFFQSPNYVYTS